MSSKRIEVRALVIEKDFKKAIGIAKKLDHSFSKEEVRSLEIAFECLNGRENYYTQLGVDTQKVINKSIELIKKL